MQGSCQGSRAPPSGAGSGAPTEARRRGQAGGIQPVLRREHPGGRGCRLVVARQHRHVRLADDLALVHALADPVHRAARAARGRPPAPGRGCGGPGNGGAGSGWMLIIRPRPGLHESSPSAPPHVAGERDQLHARPRAGGRPAPASWAARSFPNGPVVHRLARRSRPPARAPGRPASGLLDEHQHDLGRVGIRRLAPLPMRAARFDPRPETRTAVRTRLTPPPSSPITNVSSPAFSRAAITAGAKRRLDHQHEADPAVEGAPQLARSPRRPPAAASRTPAAGSRRTSRGGASGILAMARGGFSIRPPPVMWAAPLTISAIISGRTAFT